MAVTSKASGPRKAVKERRARRGLGKAAGGSKGEEAGLLRAKEPHLKIFLPVQFRHFF